MSEHDEEVKFEPKGENEIRQEIIEEFDFDEDDDKERIDKMTAKQLESQKALSKAIEQKRKHRETKTVYEERMRKAGLDPETGEKSEEKKEDKKVTDGPTERELKLEKEVDEMKMAQAGDFSEDIQNAIRTMAKMEGISYKEASKSDFIKFKIQQEDTSKRNDEAAIGGGSSGQRGSGLNLKDVKPEQIKDLKDEDWEKVKEKTLGIKSKPNFS